MTEEHKHPHKPDHQQEHSHEHGDEHEATGHHHGHGHEHDHGHPHEHRHEQHAAPGHEHEHGHDHDYGQSHEHGPGGHHHHGDHLTRFHDPKHAAEYDRRAATGGIRGDLTEKLIEILALKGNEMVLDLATGTGRVARPLAKRLQSGRVVGVDQAFAMLDVGHQHEDKPQTYRQTAGSAHALPFKPNTFDRVFVSFALHHFGNPAGVVREVLRVLKNGGRFVVLDPVIEEAKDAVDVALEARINQVFRRTHGNDFRFHTTSSIQRLLSKAGYRVPRINTLTYSFNQEGMDGIPTGRHWLEAAEELEAEAPDLAERMKKNYFSWHRHADHAHVKGSFSYGLICGVKPE